MTTRDHRAGSGGQAAELTVGRVPIAETHALRARVLRPGRPPEHMRSPVDDLPDTTAIAARTDDGTVVGSAVIYPEPCPWLPDRAGAWRLRGMATDERWRGAGVGGRVLAAALDHIASAGGTLVWCNARVPAQRFYERAGFVTHGEVWDEGDIGPHIRMWRLIGTPAEVPTPAEPESAEPETAEPETAEPDAGGPETT